MLNWIKQAKRRIPVIHRRVTGVPYPVPAMRERIRDALSTLDIPLEWTGCDTTYCGEASAILVMSIEMDAGVDMDRRSEVNRMSSILFMLLVCTYLSGILNVSFEKSAMIGSIEFVEDESELRDAFTKAMTSFESLAQENGTVKLISNAISRWITDPSGETYESLVTRYKAAARFATS